MVNNHSSLKLLQILLLEIKSSIYFILVKLLIENGADVYATNNEGKAPIHEFHTDWDSYSVMSELVRGKEFHKKWLQKTIPPNLKRYCLKLKIFFLSLQPASKKIFILLTELQF